nr:alpha/beta hydrolase [Candidatus Pantoea persica]
MEIADNYDHKHQPLAEDDGTGGLKRMSSDIVQSMLRKLATMGMPLTSDFFRVLKATYYRNALDMMEIYNHKAAVEMFTQSILEAGQAFMEWPTKITCCRRRWRMVSSTWFAIDATS